MKTFMFPGQGSQKKGMGGDLFDQFSELTAKADEILGYSIKELCLEDPRKELGQTQFTQPALFVVNALSYYKHVEQSGEKPDYVAGHSLGEFNALLAADCFTFESGLKLVKRRGELMSQVSGGAMAAVSNASKAQIEQILADNGLSDIGLANFNTPSQIVISGLKEQIEQAQAFFGEGNMMFHPLATSGAFHSKYMIPSKNKFAGYIRKFKLTDLNIPVISNVTGKPYDNEQIVDNLSNQIASSVLWSDSVQYLLDVAGQAGEEMEFVELGHGKVLTGLVRKIVRETAKAKKAAAKTTAPVAQASEPVVIKKPQSFVEAEEQVKNWNAMHQIGTRVKSLVTDYQDLETRTAAMVLFGHRAAVYMKSYNGYFDLNEVTPV